MMEFDGNDLIETPEVIENIKGSDLTEKFESQLTELTPEQEAAFIELNKMDAIADGVREDVANNPDFFDAEKGAIKWEENAPNDGAVVGSKIPEYVLDEGYQLVRYDTLDGSYFAPIDTPYEKMSLPYDESKVKVSYWEVKEPFYVEKSVAAPAFGQEGGGIQYRLNANEGRISEYNESRVWDGDVVPAGSYRDSISNLAYEGYLKPLDKKS
jgi:hypothetical protein